jgi:CspA family cold shock protein
LTPPPKARTRGLLKHAFLALSCRRPRKGRHKPLLKNSTVSIPKRRIRFGATQLEPKFTLKDIASMATGTVKFFNTQKGFGFIAPSDGSRDVFVHISAVERAGMSTLNEGQRVSYDVITERGKQAAGNLQNA